ncbi:plasmid pRiA4b ORF-3 family protein [Acidiferrimicrobium sp. IK]|uniref:plasmid pRiA4b ORF-3 family protein n=1 Tax=Acidiferrimicrobium sp. IK TaxID=2871700 RepID=UPI0021CB8BC2|nr:plasmid pRiA4b ORF-3 family protein [Acidiferrimicrobium sp. IK]MCU4186998.1 plasmid pRiA4b ORF-3 family protein [Acidiferrimicrobium sp. IK]
MTDLGADRPTQLTVHRLRVTLLDVTPPIWRELRVPSVVGLQLLHAVIQIAMGWEDRHLHEWRVEDRLYVPPDEEDWGEGALDESSVTLADVGPPDAAFHYLYDMADGWEHLVEVVAVTPYDATVVPLACLDGARACPPEDIGGAFGYEHLLDALSDPDDSEHEEMVELYGDSFRPEDFEMALVNERLEELWQIY